MRGGIAGGQNGGVVAAGFAHRNHVADFHLGGGDIALAAVDFDVAVADDLPGLGAAGAEAHAVNGAVETALESGHQQLAGDPFGLRGLLVRTAELGFQHAVNTAHLLLLAKLEAIADDLRLAVLAMLPGHEVALFNGALLAVAALTFEIKFHALAPALPANRADVSCQVVYPIPFYFRCGLRPWQAF